MRAVALVSLILVAGCSRDPDVYVWSRPGSTQAELDRDDARCRNEGMAIAGMNPYAYAGQAFHNCMRASGWKLKGVA